MAVVDNLSAKVNGDAVTVTGTVDGKTHTVRVWKSYLDKLPNKTARRNYVAQRLKATADREQETAVDLSGGAITI